MAPEPSYFTGVDGGANWRRSRKRGSPGAPLAMTEEPTASGSVDFDAAMRAVRETMANATRAILLAGGGLAP
jgi:hypothetical protein